MALGPRTNSGISSIGEGEPNMDGELVKGEVGVRRPRSLWPRRLPASNVNDLADAEASRWREQPRKT